MALQAGQDRHTSTVSATSGGLGLFGGGGSLDVWRTKRISGAVDESTNAPTTLDAGGTITVVAGQNLAVTGSAVVAGGVARLSAGHDLTIDPGTNRTLSVTRRSVAGVGIGASVDDSGVSTTAGYHSKATTVAGDTTTAEASAIVGGTGVVITAGNDATLTATDIASGGDVTVAAGRNLSLLSQGPVSHGVVTRSQTVIGLKTEASQNLSGAVDQLQGAVATAGSGHGGSGYQAIGAASAVMQATDGAMALTHPALSASVTLGATHSQSRNDAQSDTQRPTTIQAAGSISLSAGQDAHLQGTQVEAGDRLDVAAGRDLTIESAVSSGSSSQAASSWQVGAGLGGSVGLSGATVGFTANGAVSQSQGGSQSTTNVNAQLSAGTGLSLTSGRDTTVAGATIGAPDVAVTVGGDLTVASRQDTAQGGSTSFHASASVTIGQGTDPSSGSLSIGGGRSSSDRAWTDHQTTIHADDGLRIDVGGHTQIDGAVIASGTGNLSLSTGTLTVTDLQDHDRGNSVDVTVGSNFATGGGDGKGTTDAQNQNQAQNPAQKRPSTTPNGQPVGASVSGQVADHEKEGVSRGTIGSGTITIRDPVHQSQDVPSINRDPSQAQAVTKDTSSGVKFYGSTSSVQEAASGFQGIREGINQVAAALGHGLGALPSSLSGVSKGDKLSSATEFRQELIDRGATPEAVDALFANPDFAEQFGAVVQAAARGTSEGWQSQKADPDPTTDDQADPNALDVTVRLPGLSVTADQSNGEQLLTRMGQLAAVIDSLPDWQVTAANLALQVALGGPFGPLKAYVASKIIDATVGDTLANATDATGKAIFGFLSGRSWDDTGGDKSQATMQTGAMLAAGLLITTITGAVIGKISKTGSKDIKYSQKTASSALQGNKLSMQLAAENAAGARAPAKINSYSQHAQNQIAGRDGGKGVRQAAIDDAFENPINIKYQPSKYGPTFQYVGKEATVAVNPQGTKTTAWVNNSAGVANK